MTVQQQAPVHVPSQEPLGKEGMLALIDRHMAAEAAGDVDGALAVYTDDVVHDVIGSPTGPLSGPDQVRPFYEMLTANLATSDIRTNREHYGQDFCVVEHQWTGTVTGEFLGVPGQGRPVDFRMLHVFEFRGGLISRETVWLDGGTIIAQLTG